MDVQAGKAARLLDRLAKYIEGDGADVEIDWSDAREYDVDESGRVVDVIEPRAEAFLIVRGPQASRAKAVARLFAELNSR